MIENSLQISAYVRCWQCLQERPDCIPPQKWSRLDVGWTANGLQVWCRRHECNVVNIDFEGQKHPANTTRKAER